MLSMDHVAMIEQALAVLGSVHPVRHRQRLIGVLDMQVDTIDLADALLGNDMPRPPPSGTRLRMTCGRVRR
jgi:hypothetical protein